MMILLIIFWISFYFMHSLLASFEVKDFVKERFPLFNPYYRVVFNLFAIVTFALIWLYQRSLPEVQLVAEKTWMNFAGYFLMAAGFISGIIALRNYDLSEFAGTKQLKQDFITENDGGGVLVTSGYNSIVRHPLYFSGIIFFAGFLLQSFTQTNLVFISISVLYLFIGAKLEENKLEKIFGEKYKSYKKKVKMLIPWIF